MDADGSPSDSVTTTREEYDRSPAENGSSTCWRAGHYRRSMTMCCASGRRMRLQAWYSSWVAAASDASTRSATTAWCVCSPVLMARLGHASPDSTKIYTRISDHEVVEDYRRALETGDA